MTPYDHPELDPVLADAVRRAYVRPVDEVTAQRHLSAIAAATASAGTEPGARRSRGRRRVWPPALAATAATLLLPVGLAAAGVSLPSAVKRPYGAVGITLPHQARDSRPAPAPATTPTQTTTPASAESRRAAGEPTPRAPANTPSSQRAKQRHSKPAVPPGRPDAAKGQKPRSTPTDSGSAAKPGRKQRRPRKALALKRRPLPASKAPSKAKPKPDAQPARKRPSTKAAPTSPPTAPRYEGKRAPRQP